MTENQSDTMYPGAFPGRALPLERIRRILIRATNWVGDAVMTLPALEAVREQFPDRTIRVLARPWVVPIFEHHPAVDEVIVYRKGEGVFDTLREMWRVAGEIRAGGFDLAILFQNAFEAALLVRLGGVPFRLGYAADGRGLLLTHPVPRDARVLRVHQVEYYLEILRAAGFRAESGEPRLYPAQQDLSEAAGVLTSLDIGEGDRVVGLSPGAMFGEAKRWHPERFARVGDWAVERWGARVLVFGSGREQDICARVTEAMVHPAHNLCGATTLGVAMGLIGRCSDFLTNDSGLMHVAAALGVATTAVFGSTNVTATGPRGPKTSVVMHHTDCAPCLKPVCPSDFRCMEPIGPEEVWEAMERLALEGGPEATEPRGMERT